MTKQTETARPARAVPGPQLAPPAALPEPMRDLLTAVLEALDLPYPATVGGSEAHDRLLNDRASHVRIALRSVLDGCPLGPGWTAGYLRERIAGHPVAGYVTVDQAQAALDAGATWSEAVTLPAGEDQ